MSVVDTRHPTMAESGAPARPDRDASLVEAQKLKDKIEKLRGDLVCSKGHTDRKRSRLCPGRSI